MSERLENIKANTGFIYSAESESVESADVKLSDYEWLIQQAEQTESFKKLHKNYLDRFTKEVGKRNEVLDLCKDFRNGNIGDIRDSFLVDCIIDALTATEDSK